MFKYTLMAVTVAAVLTGCGGSSSDSSQKALSPSSENIVKSDRNYHLAKDTLVHNVEKNFNGYTLKVLTDKTIGDDDTSNDFIVLYGLIDGKDTGALLILNANYPRGTKVVVEAYSGNKLVAKSNPTVINSNKVNFGSIKTH